MKKLLDLLANGRRSQEHAYNFSDASLTDNKNYHFCEANIFKYYPFDSDGYDTSNGIEYSRVKSLDNSEERLTRSLSNPHFSSSSTTANSQPKNDFSLTSDSDSSNMAIEKETMNSNDRKNIYVINISNSKNFLIGSQKTINIKEQQRIKESDKDWEAHHRFKNYSSYFKTDFQNLLDCQKRLTQKYISLISKHVDDQWKEFLIYLGLDKTVVETLEFRNNNSRILCVYDGLRKYMTLFPNTSLGFVIFALCQVQQVLAIEKLAEEINKESDEL